MGRGRGAASARDAADRGRGRGRHRLDAEPAGRGRHVEPGGFNARGAAAAPGLSRGAAAGGDSGADGHLALRRGQGQPVPAARLQPGPRHRPGELRRRGAGEHAHPCPRPGLYRPELPDPGACGRRHLHQGAVFRGRGRLLRRGVRPHPTGGHAGPAAQRLGGIGGRPAPVPRRLAQPGGRRASAGRAGAVAPRRPVDASGQRAQDQPGAAL